MRSVIAILLGCLALAAATARAQSPRAAEPAAPLSAEESAIDRRAAEERALAASRFAITPHKPNYLLPVSYNRYPDQRFAPLESWEIKFQLSLKLELVRDLLGGDVYFGYTQQSYWQAFNSDISSPFRETNYEPELMWSFRRARTDGGPQYRGIVLGLSHQSNGQPLPQSRSWNRVYANLIFEYEDFYFSLKPWYRIPEGGKTAPTDTRGDDNPDITDYLGHAELTAMWIRGDNRYGLMVRNNLDSPNHGALQLDWSFPIRGRLQGYVQYFGGYGESLIDYDHRVRRLGFGVMLNNWL